jgi:hypothetical protein
MSGRLSLRIAMSFVGIALALPMTLAGQESSDMTHDGLTHVERSRVDALYTLPDADFSAYNSFIILEPYVAFRKDWQRDINRNASASRRVSSDDMERIKLGMTELFLEVFTEELEDGDYSVVGEPGDNVMIVRPAIIDLDVAAPDVASAGRSRNYVTSAGSARVYIEFFDSVTGQILARAVDFQRARDTGSFQWATSVSNRSDARAVLRRWADMLVDALDEVHDK